MSKGTAVAHLALEKLLRRAERAWSQNAERDISLVFSESSFSEYLKLPFRADKEDAHAELRNAERQGAINIEWDKLAGEYGHIVRIRLVNQEIVATVLQSPPLWTVHKEACLALDVWKSNPVVDEILKRWRAGKLVRGCGPDRVVEFSDACKVIDACRNLSKNEDIPVRRMSAALFSDSKRIEAISPALDALTSESIESPRRDVEEVLSPMGLVKLPQPVLLAGNGHIELNDEQQILIPPIFIGLPPQSIRNVVLGLREGYVLTVENLTTFYEIAMGKAGPINGIVLYTAGMPSPALLRIYRMLLKAAPTWRRWHWGDVDLGGMRIAAALARQAESPLDLWMMDPAELKEVTHRKMLSEEERQEIRRIGDSHDWKDIAARIAEGGRAIEQEAIPNVAVPAPGGNERRQVPVAEG